MEESSKKIVKKRYGQNPTCFDFKSFWSSMWNPCCVDDFFSMDHYQNLTLTHSNLGLNAKTLFEWREKKRGREINAKIWFRSREEREKKKVIKVHLGALFGSYKGIKLSMRQSNGPLSYINPLVTTN